MAVEIENINSEVAVIDGDLPLSDRQLEKLVQLVVAHLEKKQGEANQFREATAVRRCAAPPLEIGE